MLYLTPLTCVYRQQGGNVLFLILIGVVLLAALSFAVTSTSRMGSDSAGTERNKVGGAAISQYPAALKTAMTRMIIDGLDYSQVKFNPPSDFAAIAAAPAEGVFHPAGGGAAYQMAGPDVMANDQQGQWYFNINFELQGVGMSSAASPDGNDVIAFLPGIKQAVCESVNQEVGIASPIPVTNDYLAAIEDTFDDSDSETIPNETVALGAAASGATGLQDKAQGCFRNTAGGVFVYYQVLGER